MARKCLIENAVLWVRDNFNIQNYRMGDIYRRAWAKYRELDREYLDSRVPAFPSQKFWVSLDVLVSIANKHLLSHSPRTYNVKMKDSSGEYYILVPETDKFDYTTIVQDGDCPSVNWILDLEELVYIRMSCGNKEIILEVDEESNIRVEDINKFTCFECFSFHNVEERRFPWYYDYESRRNTGSSNPVFSIDLCQECYEKAKDCTMVYGYSWFEGYEFLSNNYWDGGSDHELYYLCYE